MRDQPYVVRISFHETVRGAARSYTHDKSVRARSYDEACRLAVDDFWDLARKSSVGWIRSIERVDVRPERRSNDAWPCHRPPQPAL